MTIPSEARRWYLMRMVLAWGAAAVAAASHAAAHGDEPKGAAPQRMLHFPSDQAVGTLFSKPTSDKPLVHSMYGDEWQAVGEARGDVPILGGTDVRLDVGGAASANLAGLDGLAPGDLQAINLRDTDVRDDGLKHVGLLTGLRAIDLCHTRITDEGIKHLGNLTKLEEISLDAFRVDREGYGVGDEAMKVLGQLPSLRNVGLRLTKVTDAGLAELVKCPAITYLGLAGTQVSDAGLAHLKRLPSLDGLQLGVYREGAKITDDGLKLVGELTNLKHLDLSGTKVTDEGLAHLRNLAKLTRLSVDSTKVTEAGLAHLEPLQALEDIRLYTGRAMTDVAAEHLSKLKSLERISDNLQVTDKGVAALAALPALKQVFFYGEGVTDSSAASIAGMKSLTWLWFQSCPISDAMLEAIAELPNLELLFVTRTHVTGDGFRHLQKMPKLSVLDVDFGSRDEQAARSRPHLREIGKLAQLKDLRIKGDGLTSDDLQHLTGLLQLERLDAELPVDDEGAFNLAGLDRLKSLQLRNGVFTDVGLEQLSLLQRLEFVQLSGHFTDKGLERLARLKSLRRAYIGSPYVTDAGRQALGRLLPTLQHALADYVPGLRHSDITISDKDTIRRYGDPQERARKDALEGQPPPPLSVTGWVNVDSAGLDLANLDGKVVVVDFWGTWCGPCRAFTPKLKEMHEKYSAQGLVILGVHTADGADKMPEYVAKEALAWPQAVDVKKTTVGAWKVESYPTLYVIDRRGRVRFAGPYRGDLERAVLQLLQETAPPAGPGAG